MKEETRDELQKCMTRLAECGRATWGIDQVLHESEYEISEENLTPWVSMLFSGCYEPLTLACDKLYELIDGDEELYPTTIYEDWNPRYMEGMCPYYFLNETYKIIHKTFNELNEILVGDWTYIITPIKECLMMMKRFIQDIVEKGPVPSYDKIRILKETIETM